MLSLFRRLLNFFIFSNLFIACCAVLMVHQTSALLLHQKPDFNFLGFAFFASICSYSFHWYLTPDIDLDSVRLHWLTRNRVVHVILFFIGAAGAAWYGLTLLSHWPWLLLSAFITFLYSAPKIPLPLFRELRKVALGKTIFLAFVWMYVTTALPLQISGTPWRPEFTVFAVGRFFFIYAVCIVFDYRDREYDRSIGIRSLITWLSDRGITILFIVSLLIYAVSTTLLLRYGYSELTVLILILPAIILAILYRRLLTNFSDMMYYLVLDGLMALPALLTLIPLSG